MEYNIEYKARMKRAAELISKGYEPEVARFWENKTAVIRKLTPELCEISIINEPSRRIVTYVSTVFDYVEKDDAIQLGTDSFSLEELQQKIYEFKEYLEKVNNANDCCIDVLFNTANGRDRRVGTELKIRKINID